MIRRGLDMHILPLYYVHMTKRTTIELDEELLARAKRALGQPTTRATVEEALRRAAETAEREFNERRARQLRYFEELDKYLDLDVLASDEMWR
jgi:Arc/MetJ family transcription regulator